MSQLYLFDAPRVTAEANPRDRGHIPLQRPDSDPQPRDFAKLFSPAELQDFKTLRESGVNFAVCAGTATAIHLGLEEPCRPESDIDIMLDPEKHQAAIKALSGGNAYDFEPLFWPFGMPTTAARFLEKGRIEATGGSDGTPAYFTLTRLVLSRCIIPAWRTGELAMLRVVCPTEVILNKLCWRRPKDQQGDLPRLLGNEKIRKSLDYGYMAARTIQTYADKHLVAERLGSALESVHGTGAATAGIKQLWNRLEEVEQEPARVAALRASLPRDVGHRQVCPGYSLYQRPCDRPR